MTINTNGTGHLRTAHFALNVSLTEMLSDSKSMVTRCSQQQEGDASAAVFLSRDSLRHRDRQAPLSVDSRPRLNALHPYIIPASRCLMRNVHWSGVSFAFTHMAKTFQIHMQSLRGGSVVLIINCWNRISQDMSLHMFVVSISSESSFNLLRHEQK